jgi:cyclic pyranopterin phosphate synthase
MESLTIRPLREQGVERLIEPTGATPPPDMHLDFVLNYLFRYNAVMPTLDRFRRAMRDLRISVTDRCNFRCTYCMPFDEYTWIERREVLSFEEIERLARVFLGFGIEKIRLTGGEPLVRKDLHRLIGRLTLLEGLGDLAVTTNGALLAAQAEALHDAGLRRINVSIDSLRPDRFTALTKRGNLDEVLAGVFAAKKAGMSPIKINAVIIRGTNEDEILDLVEFARVNGFEMRFIEYMDVGNANAWSLERTVTKKEILDKVNSRFPVREIGRANGSAPAVDYEFLDGGGEIGIIGSVTEPFCSSCTRVRLTADGKLVTCLFAESGFDLKGLLRSGVSDEQLIASIANIWAIRTDRYSDLRWEQMRAGTYQPGDHKKIEMITLGG